jgi:hypothetical protein
MLSVSTALRKRWHSVRDKKRGTSMPQLLPQQQDLITCQAADGHHIQHKLPHEQNDSKKHGFTHFI